MVWNRATAAVNASAARVTPAIRLIAGAPAPRRFVVSSIETSSQAGARKRTVHYCGKPRLLRFVERIFEGGENRRNGVDALAQGLQLFPLGVEAAERREPVFGGTCRDKCAGGAVDRRRDIMRGGVLLVRK